MTSTHRRLRKLPSILSIRDVPHQQIARVVPSMARSLLALAAERGVSTELLCRGLGFSLQSLQDAGALMSYQQVRSLVLRAIKVFKDPALALAVGARQTPVSWGLTGLAMATCRTFGEAALLSFSHQDLAGALVHHVLQESDDEVVVALVPHVPDVTIEAFLIESSMAALVAVFRALMQTGRSPSWVEVAYARPGHSQAYRDFFRCPVRFNAHGHRLAFDPEMLNDLVPGYDPVSGAAVNAQLLQLLVQPVVRHELVQTVNSNLRISLNAPPSQRELARKANVSERTLRRRLSEQDTSFSALRDSARFERAARVADQFDTAYR